MFRVSLLSVGLTQVLNSLRSRKKSNHNAVKFSYELNFYTIISHLYSRFTAKDFCISRFTEYTSSRFTEQFFFYQITIHRGKKKIGSRRHENTLASPLCKIWQRFLSKSEFAKLKLQERLFGLRIAYIKWYSIENNTNSNK